jgi:hypothetical protein
MWNGTEWAYHGEEHLALYLISFCCLIGVFFEISTRHIWTGLFEWTPEYRCYLFN